MVSIPIRRNKAILKKLFAELIREDGFICGGFARYRRMDDSNKN